MILTHNLQTMIQILNKNLSFTTSFHHHHHLQFFPLSSSKTLNPPSKSPFITSYLISTFGFSPHKAATASKQISHLTSPEKPDSVRHFFKHLSFTESDLRSIVSQESRILSYDPATTLEPNYRALHGSGYFSESELRRLIKYQPCSIRSSPAAILSRIEFWKKFMNDDTKKLLLAFTRNPGLMSQGIDSGITQKIKLLMEYGLSKENVGMILLRGPGVMRRGLDSMEVVLKKVEELGFPRKSSKFIRGLTVLSMLGLKNFKEKMEVFKSYGWLESEFLAAFLKDPTFVAYSEKTIREKMDFLLERAECKNSEIKCSPTILGFSLRKRMMPRNYILRILESRNIKLAGRGMCFYTIVRMSEEDFIQKIIHVNKEQIQELLDIYVAACAGEVPL